jgi:RNA polymerase sigma-70 factor (ECF subfamily)
MIALTCLAVIQLLPPRQRAVLLLRDVLGWSAGEAAAALETSVAAANSALQRARATLRERLPGRPSEWSGGEPSEHERALLAGFIDAHERADAAAAAALVREDIRITMPPHPWCYDGLATIAPLLGPGLSEPGDRRLLPHPRQPPAGRRQLPAGARRPRAPGVQAGRAARRGRQDRGDHHLRRAPVPGVRLPPTLPPPGSPA